MPSSTRQAPAGLAGLHTLIEACKSLEAADLGVAGCETIRRSMLDSLGVAVAGAASPVTRGAVRMLDRLYGCGEVSIPGSAASLPLLEAVFAMGVSLHALDFDDTGGFSQGHPSAAVFPTIFCLAQTRTIDGPEAIAAYATGVEFLSRFSRAMPMLHLRGWHPTAALGAVTAAATASRLLQLSTDRFEHAIGIAASLGSGLVANFGSMAKPLQVGAAVRQGLLAALLADEGMTASSDAIFGRRGMLSTYFGDEHLGTSWLVKPEGAWTVTDPGLNIKRYASCALTHRCIDAALALRAEHAIAPDTIDSVVCFCPPRASEVLRYPSATDGLEARFCMPFAVASALIHGDVGPSELDGGGFATVIASGLVQRIDLRVHPDWHDGDDARPDLVEIRLHSGERLQRAVAWPKGHARNPIEWPDVVGKFRRCTSGHLRDERAEQCVAFIKRLGDQRSIGALAGLVA